MFFLFKISSIKNFNNNKDRVMLVDFNPYGSITDTLLFDWNDFISNDDDDEVLFRYVEAELENAINENQFSSYQVPKDVNDIFVGGDYSKLLDLVKMVFYFKYFTYIIYSFFFINIAN